MTKSFMLLVLVFSLHNMVLANGPDGTQIDKSKPQHAQQSPGGQKPTPQDGAARPMPLAPPQQGPSDGSQPNQINRRIADYTGNLATYTGWLMVATFILALIAGLQAWQAIWGQRKLERAYGFGGPSLTRGQRQEGLLVRLQFGNYGRTPAFLKIVEWEVRPESTLPATPTYSNRIMNEMTVLTGDTPNTEASYLARIDWNEPHVLYARFTYEDIYSSTHQSSGIWRIRPSGPLGGVVAAHPPLGGFPEYVKWN